MFFSVVVSAHFVCCDNAPSFLFRWPFAPVNFATLPFMPSGFSLPLPVLVSGFSLWEEVSIDCSRHHYHCFALQRVPLYGGGAHTDEYSIVRVSSNQADIDIWLLGTPLQRWD